MYILKWVCDSKRGTGVYLEPCQTSKMECFGEIVNGE